MKHLNEEKRIKLDALKKSGITQSKIAEILGCNQSTVSREIRRNGSKIYDSYTANIAELRSRKRIKDRYNNFKYWYHDKNIFNTIISELKDGRSPEQIEGRRKKLGLKTVSHQAIYNYLKEDKKSGGKLYKSLRYQGKKYKWFGFTKTKDDKITNRVGIEHRPDIVNQKGRYGDWGSDLVVSSRKGSGAVDTFTERRSMYFYAIKVESKSGDEMFRATNEVLGGLPPQMRNTMTHDNGREISSHEDITRKLDMPVYCARPYKSCDRGLNEWMNRELRRFFPKGTDFSKIKQEEIDYAVNWLNNCSRKSLDFRTPKKVFDEQLEIMRLVV